MIKKIIILIFIITNIFHISSNEKDKNLNTIKLYYKFLNNKNTIKKAYEISPQKVKFETYYSWYKDIDKIYTYNIKKIAADKYQFYVFLEENGETLLFKVTMEVKNDSIISSSSKKTDSYILKSFPYKEDKQIVFTDNIKKDTKYIYLTDKNMKNKILIAEFPYEEFGNNIVFDFIIEDFVFFNYSAWEFYTRYVYDVKKEKLHEIPFDYIYVSPDKNYAAAYGEGGMSTIEGKRLIIFDNKYYGIDLKKDESYENIEMDKKNKKIILKDKSGNELRRIKLN